MNSNNPLTHPIVRLDRRQGALQVLSVAAILPQEKVGLKIDRRIVTEFDIQNCEGRRGLGLNLLADPHLHSFSLNWRPEISTTVRCAQGINLALDWTLHGANTGYFGTFVSSPAGEGKLIYVDPFYGEWLPISANCRYLFTCHVGAHRCAANLLAEIKNTEGDVYQCAGPIVPDTRLGGRELAGYKQTQIEVAPSNQAEAIRFSIQKFGTIEGADSFLFMVHPAFFVKPDSDEHLRSDLYLDDVLRVAAIRLFASDRAFKISVVRLPAHCSDGLQHLIEIIDPKGSAVGGIHIFQRITPSRARIDSFDGIRLIGSIVIQPHQTSGRLRLKVDGHQAGTASIFDRTNRQIKFTASIPARYLDGRSHELSVVNDDDATIATSVGVTAQIAVQTTFDAERATLSNLNKPRAMYQWANLTRLHWRYNVAVRINDQDGICEFGQRILDASICHVELNIDWKRRTEFSEIEFPSHKSPEVSLVIWCQNDWHAIYNCLQSLKFAFNETTFEIIIIDDSSSDETRSLETIIKGVNVVRNRDAEGFLMACNAGAAAARGKFIVILDPKVEVTGCWLDEMVLLFKTYPRVGLVGSKLLFDDGRLQAAGALIYKSANLATFGRDRNPDDPECCYVRESDFVLSTSIMIDRAIWDAAGGFNTSLGPGYYADADLALRIRARGYFVLYAPHSVVFGLESLNNNDADMQLADDTSRERFRETWETKLRDSSTIKPGFAMCRRVQRTCLMIDHGIPRPDFDAAGYAAIQEIRLLQSLGYTVTFIPQDFKYLSGYVPLLQRLGVQVICAPCAATLTDFLSPRGDEFDLIYVTRYRVARAIINDARMLCPNTRIVLNLADLHFLRESRVALQNNKLAKQVADKTQQDIIQIRNDELDVISRVDLALTYSNVEQKIITELTNHTAKIGLCPWVVDVKDRVPGFIERRDIAFLGNFSHAPNVQAVSYFIENVMPLLRRKMRGLKFIIYGSDAEAKLRLQLADDIVVAGRVDNLEHVYSRCRVFVVPLISGAGIKGKVIGGLAYGVPQVLSPLASEGTAIRNGQEAIIAEAPSKWVAAISLLYEDRLKWEAMSRAARALASSHYSFARGREMMANVLRLVDLAEVKIDSPIFGSCDVTPLFRP